MCLGLPALSCTKWPPQASVICASNYIVSSGIEAVIGPVMVWANLLGVRAVTVKLTQRRDPSNPHRSG